jgi:hypothetical protein
MGRVKLKLKVGDNLKVSLPDIPDTKSNKNLISHPKEKVGSGQDPSN